MSGQALAVAPDGKLLFSGGHWDGSLRVTALPRGRLLSQLRCHLGTCCLGAPAVRGGGAGLRADQGGITSLFPLFPLPSLFPVPSPPSPPLSHADVVTCLALDTCGIYLISGSRDTTCMVWRLMQQVCWVAAPWGPLGPDLRPICPSVGLQSYPALFPFLLLL